MERLEEIKSRLQQILSIIENEKNSEDTNFEELEEEARKLIKEKKDIEAREELKNTLAEERNQTNVVEEAEVRELGNYTPDVVTETKHETRDAIQSYIQSKGEVREGFTSVEGGALIPEELLKPNVVPSDVVDLSKVVNSTQVNSGAGRYPVIKKSEGRMNTVAELEQNPELSKPSIQDVNYDIETYRGYIPVSQEVIDDADYNVIGLIADEISGQELNTRNDAIATVLKAAPAKTVSGIDGLKELFNVDIKQVYNSKAIISASFYNSLDTAKDGNGRYLLQDDITVASGKRLLGKEVIVLDDEVLGLAGDKVGFIGDPKAYATFFDRKRTSVKWVDHNVYGQLLAGFIRFDVQAVDQDAGFFVTYEPDGEPTP